MDVSKKGIFLFQFFWTLLKTLSPIFTPKHSKVQRKAPTMLNSLVEQVVLEQIPIVSLGMIIDTPLERNIKAGRPAKYLGWKQNFNQNSWPRLQRTSEKRQWTKSLIRAMQRDLNLRQGITLQIWMNFREQKPVLYQMHCFARPHSFNPQIVFNEVIQADHTIAFEVGTGRTEVRGSKHHAQQCRSGTWYRELNAGIAVASQN